MALRAAAESEAAPAGVNKFLGQGQTAERAPALMTVLRPVLPLIIGASIFMFGHSVLNLATALKLNQAGISASSIGLVQSAFFLGFLIGCLVIKKLIRRVSHIRAYAVFGALAVTTVLVQALIFDPLVWIVCRMAYGVAMAGFTTAIESWLNDRTDNETRGRVLTFYMASYYFTVGLGQLSINLFDLAGIAVLVFAGLALAFSLQPVLLTNLPQPEVKSAKPMSVFTLFKVSPLAVVGATGAGLLQSGLNSMAPIFATQIGYSLFQVSLFTGALVVGPFLLLWIVGRISDNLGRRRALSIVLTLLTIIAVAIYSLHWLEPHFLIMVAMALLLGGGSASVYPNSIAHAYDQLPKESYVSASTSLLICFSSGAILGPSLASWIMAWFGPHALFLYSATFAALLLLFIVYRWRVRPEVLVVGKEAFVPVAPTSRLAPQLDPRRLRSQAKH